MQVTVVLVRDHQRYLHACVFEDGKHGNDLLEGLWLTDETEAKQEVVRVLRNTAEEIRWRWDI